MKSLRTIEYAARLRRYLLWAWLFLAAVALVLGATLPGHPLGSGAIGVAAATLIIGVSAYSISKMVASSDLGIGWLALDYLVKVGAIALALLVPKAIGGFNLALIAGTVIAAIIVTLALQLVAMKSFQGEQ